MKSIKLTFIYIYSNKPYFNRNENDVPSSKWRRELIYDTGALACKADGILFNYDDSDHEFLIFENIGPPLETKNSKYHQDLLKSFRNCVDSICRLFWRGIGDVKLASRYYVLAYVVYSEFFFYHNALLNSLYLY